LKRALSLAALVGSLLGCTNFQDPTRVIDLRMLGVQVEPSEIILDADISDPANPTAANNPPVLVTPLIADPAGGGRPVTYTISACPNDPFAPAAPGGGQGGGAFPSGGARTTVGSALCDESSPKTWKLQEEPVPVDLQADPGSSVMVSPTIAQLAVAFMTDIFPDQYGNLHGGFDLGMPLTLDIKVHAGNEEIHAVKRILYWALPIDGLQKPNQLPRIDGVRTYRNRDTGTLDPVGEVTTLEPDPAAPFVVPAGTSSIWIEPARDTPEPFQTTVIDPDTHLAVPFTVPRETLRSRFFATAGTFAPIVTSSEPELGFVATGPIHVESEYSLPGAGQLAPGPDGTATVTIWIVVRDDRGGEFWVRRTLVVTPR
jgi:hypothetical protein